VYFLYEIQKVDSQSMIFAELASKKIGTQNWQHLFYLLPEMLL